MKLMFVCFSFNSGNMHTLHQTACVFVFMSYVHITVHLGVVSVTMLFNCKFMNQAVRPIRAFLRLQNAMPLDGVIQLYKVE